MSHKETRNNVFNFGVCTEDKSNDLENAYLFGYLSALEDRLERLEFRADKLETTCKDLFDLDDEDDEDEDEEMFSNRTCRCCREVLVKTIAGTGL